MDQDRITSTEVAIKALPTLENIPEDVAALIADSIKSWVTVERNLEQREKARRLRDSTLRAVALSCRRSHTFFTPALLQNVTINIKYLLSFLQLLRTNESYGRLVKSLHYNGDTIRLSEDAVKLFHRELVSESNLKDAAPKEKASNGLFRVIAFIQQALPNLQTLIIESMAFVPLSFLQLSCFPHCLKKLYLPLMDYSYTFEGTPLNARNVIWLLKFGQIQEAALGCTISVLDFDYLSFHHQSFSGHSKVKELSLQVEFAHKKSDRSTWWGLPKERNRKWSLGSKKTDALFFLLSVTDQLLCLEVCPFGQDRRNPGDETDLNLGYLSSLIRSSDSLRHLRLLNHFPLSDLPLEVPLEEAKDLDRISLFSHLNTLSIDRDLLSLLEVHRHPQFPLSLEKIILPYYRPANDLASSLKEDSILLQVIQFQSLSQLKEVFVPTKPISIQGEVLDDSDFLEDLKVWAEKRQELEKAAIFKSGKLALRTYSAGESVTSEAETFMSCVSWLSPF